MTTDSEPAIRVSILIVTHQSRDLLASTLERVHSSDGRDPRALGRELLVVDNASTDGTSAMVRSRFPDVQILEPGVNLGFGAANNLAARHARGDLLLLLNSDAWPRVGTIERLAATLDAQPDAAVACPRLLYANGRPQFHWAPWTGVVGEALQKLRNRVEARRWAHRPLPGLGWFTAACLMVRRRAFEQVGGFDERFFLYFEDVDLCRRLADAGWRLLDAPAASAVHLKGASQGGGPGEVAYRRSQLLYYALHRPAWERLWLLRRLRRKFARRDDAARPQLLALLDESPPTT
ncbi:MAG: glycosyltransferase family 2 protein [Acidobacteriota bacterium]